MKWRMKLTLWMVIIIVLIIQITILHLEVVEIFVVGITLIIMFEITIKFSVIIVGRMVTFNETVGAIIKQNSSSNSSNNGLE